MGMSKWVNIDGGAVPIAWASRGRLAAAHVIFTRTAAASDIFRDLTRIASV